MQGGDDLSLNFPPTKDTPLIFSVPKRMLRGTTQAA